MVRMAKMVLFSKTACHLTAVDGQHPAKKQFTFMLSRGESPIIRPATGFCSSNQGKSLESFSKRLEKASRRGGYRYLLGRNVSFQVAFFDHSELQ